MEILTDNWQKKQKNIENGKFSNCVIQIKNKIYICWKKKKIGNLIMEQIQEQIVGKVLENSKFSKCVQVKSSHKNNLKSVNLVI